MIEWITNNWATALAIFYVLEKIVKITPMKYDDILLDMVWGAIKKLWEKVKNKRKYEKCHKLNH